jgi:hypothetical protein
MIRRKSIRQEIALQKRQNTRKIKKKMFDEVCAKGKVETLRDVSSMFFGLSRKAVEKAAYREIMFHARCGRNAEEILEIMEAKK